MDYDKANIDDALIDIDTDAELEDRQAAAKEKDAALETLGEENELLKE